MKINTNMLSLISMFGALLTSGVSQAYIVERLYEAELYTKSKSETERDAVLSEGLEQVLSRISGKPNVVNEPAVQAALKNPNKYVQQYAYHGDKLEATFSPGLIQKLLKDAKLPIWSNNRPVLVMWLAIDEDNKRHLVGQETDPSIVALVEQNAQVRGLPVVVPLMDLEDMSKVTVTDVLGQFPSVLQEASSRYGHDGVLVGRLTSHQGRQSGAWRTEWELLIDGKTHTWETNGIGINQAVKQGIDGAVDKLANLYAFTASDGVGEEVFVRVEDIYSVADYAKVMKYLKSLNTVQDVLVHRVEADKTIFKIVPTKGNGLKSITAAMDLDDNMVSLASKPANIDASYRWTPQGS